MIVILTGAGISQESGIPTFRDMGGIWRTVPLEEVATLSGFNRNPERALSFFNEFRRLLSDPEIVPNPAHLALARLEQESTEPVLVVTQNIDNLHARAGSKNLLHMHGEMSLARCSACETVMDWEKDFTLDDLCPKCNTRSQMRPHVVLFEEMPFHLDEIDHALANCRLFVSIGTSGHVQPAASFVMKAEKYGIERLELNLERSLSAWFFSEGRYGKAGVLVPQWVEEVLAAQRAQERPG